MTVSYHESWFKLLLRWRGSIWKDCYLELIIFLVLYYIISLVYRLILTPDQRVTFEDFCICINAQTRQIPITFLLGFFVSNVVKRWWDQFERIPWPEELLSRTCIVISGEEYNARLKRRTIARYVCLSMALCYRDISTPVFKRFQTVHQLVRVGLMTQGEYTLYNQTELEAVKWFLPLQWAQKIVEKDSAIRKTPPNVVQAFIKDLNLYRQRLRHLYCFDWVCVPMVYTQVVTIATYGYFFLCLFGRQFLDPTKKYHEFEMDYYVPIVSMLQLIFYIGWFKPFGSDDDDLELSYLLDRNVRVAMAVVDSVYDQSPALDCDPLEGRSLNQLMPWTRLTIQQTPPIDHIRMNSAKMKSAEKLDQQYLAYHEV